MSQSTDRVCRSSSLKPGAGPAADAPEEEAEEEEEEETEEEGRGRVEGGGREGAMDRPVSVAPAAVTPANDHFCDYATGPRLLAANHKNDTDRCAITHGPPLTRHRRGRNVEGGGANMRRKREVEKGWMKKEEWKSGGSCTHRAFEDRGRQSHIEGQGSGLRVRV